MYLVQKSTSCTNCWCVSTSVVVYLLEMVQIVLHKNSQYKMYYTKQYNLYLVQKSTTCTIDWCMSASVACRNSTNCTSQKNSEYKTYYYKKYNLYLVQKSTICITYSHISQNFSYASVRNKSFWVQNVPLKICHSTKCTFMKMSEYKMYFY